MTNMKKIIVVFASVAMLFSCRQAVVKPDGSITVTDSGLIICDMGKVTDTLEVPLSEWVEDLQVVRFENSDTALFRMQWLSITDKHIAIQPYHRQPMMLFDYQGKFLCNVGVIGNGPGEYGSLSSHAIDEKNECIYLLPFFGQSQILKYNMEGTFSGKIDLGEHLNKGKIKVNSDGTLSLVHLCFDGQSRFQVAHAGAGGVIKSCPPYEHQNIKQTSEYFTGFDHEVWCYKNTEDFKYMITNCDTLYRYDVEKNVQKADFVLSNLQKDEKAWFILNPLPNKYLAIIMGQGTVVADVQKRRSYFVKLTNDFMGGIPAPVNFTDGYFFAMYEPGKLITLIEKRLDSSDCTDKDKQVLNNLLGSLNEEGNNIMFMGKLKE